MRERILSINAIIRQQVDTKGRLSVKVTGASCIGNTVVGVGKLFLGIISFSFFTCVSAFYTFGMVIAKACVLTGILKATNKKEQEVYYLLSGSILMAVSILYIAYSVRLFYYPVSNSYHEYVGMGIAAFTFTELALNIRGVIIERHNKAPLIHAIKMINLASSMICLVLTQTALLSFADKQGAEAHSQANGLMGVIMGSLATCLGIVMILRIKLKKEDCYD